MNHEFDILPPPPPLPNRAPVAATVQADAEFANTRADVPERTCPNCGAPAHGPYCYACGQSEKGMIRHLSEVMSDLADIVFNVDSRIFRSLWDMYLRPGFLTTEYLIGRRARYVTPFRLFFFLSIIAFFVMQASIPSDAIDQFKFDDDGQSAISNATSAEDVNARVDEAIAALKGKEKKSNLSDAALAKIERSATKIRERGDERLQELKDEVAASANGEPVKAAKPSTLGFLKIGGQPWDTRTNPIKIGWLPDLVNAKINNAFDHMFNNIETADAQRSRLIAGWFAVLPQTLFVVMPLFALLLKFFYIFKRRLYMEHLLVALHSHAFIFMSLLVIILLAWLDGLAAGSVWLSATLQLLSSCAWIWLFLYLLLMQKRVYRQGWIMTVLKYCMVGFCYTIFLSMALTTALFVSLALT
jgi:hypothetical protein